MTAKKKVPRAPEAGKPESRNVEDFSDEELVGAKVHYKFRDETVTVDALTVKRDHERQRRALAEGYVSVDSEVKRKREWIEAHVRSLRDDIAALKPDKKNAAAVSESLRSVEAMLGLVESELAVAVSEGAFDRMDRLLKEARSMYSSIFVAGIAVPALSRKFPKGKPKGAISANQRVLRKILEEQRGADENALWHDFERERKSKDATAGMKEIKRESFGSAVQRARGALGIKKGSA